MNELLFAMLSEVVKMGLAPSGRSLLYHLQQFYKGVPLSGSILDIGCGSGIIGMYPLCFGAKRLVGIDVDGSGRFERLRAVLPYQKPSLCIVGFRTSCREISLMWW